MSISVETLDKIREQLREAKHVGGSVPQDLYSHLTEVFNRIMLHHQSDAFDKFEEISALVKRTHLSFKDPKRDFEVNAQSGAQTQAEKDRQRWIEKSKNLLCEINDLASPADKKALIKQEEFTMPNFVEDAEMLEWAGVCFGEEDTHRLSKSIKRLAVMSGAKRVMFAGKILGTQRDYWVISGILQEPPENNSDPQFEQRPNGVNALVFWVTDNLLNDWIQLPDCKPQHIVSARLIKHIMSGDLNAEVQSNPPFPGKERHFLRAQLARIFAATSISPKGLFEINADTELIAFAEEFTIPGTDELKNLENWANVQKSILQNGRMSYIAPPGLDEEASEAFLASVAETDAQVDAFRAINEHTPVAISTPPVPGMETAWVSKVVGDPQQYTKGDTPVTYAVNVIKSLRWPGALTVCKGGKFTSVYIGYGIKRDENPSFYPTAPPVVDADPVDPLDQDEPNPDKDPEPVPVVDPNAQGSDVDV